MVLVITNFISEYWQLLLLIVLVFAFFIILFSYFYHRFKKDKTFKENLNETKVLQIAVTIDLEERIVERYYLYDQNHKSEIVSLDEFYMWFDKSNYYRLKNWLKNISNATDFNKTRRNELVMYENNVRHVYMVELESYSPENKRYYLLFKDHTDSTEIYKRISKVPINLDDELFYKKANERLLVADENSNNYLVAIKYKEHKYAHKELSSDALNAIEEEIYNKINKSKSENDMLCMSKNGVFILFSANVVNEKKYKSNIKKILLSNSGSYSIMQGKFNYSISLVAGYTKVKNYEGITIDKTLEAESAANYVVDKGRLVDRLQLFDENLQNYHRLINNKLLLVEKIIDESLFDLTFIPILKVKNKVINGYFVNIKLHSGLKIDMNEFLSFIKERNFSISFYDKVFAKIAAFKGISATPFYLSFDFDSLRSVVEAHQKNEKYRRMKFVFCIEFSNNTLQNNDLISIEKTLSNYKENFNLRFAISYNTLNTIYLNSKIYAQVEAIVLFGQLIENVLDKYSNETLIELYTKVANEYHHEIIGLNIKSLALYEMFSHYKVHKVGGALLTQYVIDDRIVDQSFINTLNELENKTY